MRINIYEVRKMKYHLSIVHTNDSKVILSLEKEKIIAYP